MDKKVILEKYKKSEDKLLISKFLDKIEISNRTNKIETTDFLNESEQSILQKVINLIQLKNYKFFGGYEDSDRKMVIIYPEKMRAVFEECNFKYDTLVSAFRILLPQSNTLDYSHSVYLGGIIKLGIKREKIGDILVYENGADILVKKETEKFLYGNFKSLTRFRDAQISIIRLDELVTPQKSFQDIKIVTSSLRLDNIVSELARTSRSKAVDILNQERVFVNYENEVKNTKQVRAQDVITIRGKGKFIVDEIIGNTKKGNYVVMVKKFI